MKIKNPAIRALLANPSYTPNRLLNRAAEILKARNDSHLAKKLGNDLSTLTRTRNRELQVTSDLMIAIMDETGLTLKEIRDLAGLAHKSRSSKPRAINVEEKDEDSDKLEVQ